MHRLILLGTLVAAFWALGTADAQDPSAVRVVDGAGAAGGPALYLPDGDLLNVRNIQGGVIGDTNLDIGAGSTANPGDLVLNYDVGRRTLIFDGRKHLIAAFGPGGIVFYQRPRIWPYRLRRHHR